MSRKKTQFYAIIFLFVCIGFLSSCAKQSAYPTLPETDAVLGNGSYQIMKNLDGTQQLYSMKYHVTMIDTITDSTKKGKIMLVQGKNAGETVYAVLNLENALLLFPADSNLPENTEVSSQMIQNKDLNIVDSTAFLDIIFANFK